MLPFDAVQGLMVAACGFYALQAAAVWTLLRGPSHATSVSLWTWGALAASAGALVAAYRFDLPQWVVFYLGPLLGLVAIWSRVLALRVHLGQPLQVRAALLLLLLVSVALALAQQSADLRLGAALVAAAFSAASSVFALQAESAYRTNGSRSARLLAWAEWGMAVLWLLRAGAVWLTDSPDMPPAGFTRPDFIVMVLVLAVAAMYGNLGYLGMLLDDTRRAESEARGRQMAEAAARQSAEAAAAELRALLQQRDALARDRQRMLDLLAYGIRQPLHNAGGALQASADALQHLPGARAVLAAEGLDRARSVLGGMHALLDNALAAAALLDHGRPLVTQDMDLDLLVALTLGDLSDAERSRVQVQRSTDLRSVEVDAGLMRLALRNLLRNAFQHGGHAVAVVLQLDEQTAPPATVPALLISVCDDGPGIAHFPAALAPQACGLPLPLPEHGLGLFIAHQVVARHGATLTLQNGSSGGVVARMLLPLPA